MPKGGYRKPANPAPVSGPGQLSRRTDGAQPVMNMPGGAYGEGKQLRELQQGATMAQQEVKPTPSVTGLFEPTNRPDEPVTAGMPFGAGTNTIPSGNVYSQPSLRATLEKALEVDNDPALETAYNYLINRGAI